MELWTTSCIPSHLSNQGRIRCACDSTRPRFQRSAKNPREMGSGAGLEIFNRQDIGRYREDKGDRGDSQRRAKEIHDEGTNREGQKSDEDRVLWTN